MPSPTRPRENPLLVEAAHIARRFQLIVNCYLRRAASPATLRQEGQALIDLLWEMGLRPSQTDDAQAGLPGMVPVAARRAG